MNENLDYPLPLETPGSNAWGLSPLNGTDSFDSSASGVWSQEQVTSQLGEPSKWLENNTTPSTSHGNRNGMTRIAPLMGSRTSFPNSEKIEPMSGRRGPAKKRLQCPHPDCKATFPRKYELQRHQSTIHDSKISILCSVYGCNRISRPFPRVDKFHEHVRKHHKNPHRVLCLVQTCRQGPLTREELVDHLKIEHSPRTLKLEPQIGDSLRSINLRLSFTREDCPIIGDFLACPLWVYGCGFKVGQTQVQHSASWLESHLEEEHELLERSKGYEIIISALGSWYKRGIATCPICRAKSSSIFISDHVDGHTVEDRREHAVEIAQMFRPFLTGKETAAYFGISKIVGWNEDPKFRARVEEAGVLSTKCPALENFQTGDLVNSEQAHSIV
jgi:hypothetical protein